MIASLVLAALAGENSSRPGELTLERPTYICLGVRWLIHGDRNKNAAVGFEYRKAGTEAWKKALPLFRVESAACRKKPPKGAWLFAGSVFDLEEGTEYELKLALKDPDGGEAEKVVRTRTRKEPFAPPDMRVRHVVPGQGGGDGTEGNPFRGLEAAAQAAEPGDLFLVRKGVYPATWTVKTSGTKDRPIVWRGAGDGEAIIDGALAQKTPGRGISAGDIHDVFFERLTIRNVNYGIVMHRSRRMVVRRCHIHKVEYGLTWTNNRPLTEDILVADCVIEGPSTWPRTKGIEGARGIQASGRGHVCMYNRIRGFADGVDTFGSQECSAIDFYGNDISEMTDDGIEMDYSQHNTRCFRNRMTNVFQGITTQPIYGGPVYIFRNAQHNVGLEVFKMHNDPSGVLLFHNTSVKAGMPNVLYSNRVRNSVQRNNLFIGTKANYAYESTARMVNCDFDYDGWAGKWGTFCKWNGKRYGTLADVQRAGVFQKHGILVDAATAFASGVLPPRDARAQQYPVSVNDLRLKEGCAAIDAGAVLFNINDGFRGEAPDLGAYELGDELPHYGPRPEKPKVVVARKPDQRESIWKALARRKGTPAGPLDAPAETIARAREAALEGRFEEAARTVEEEISHVTAAEDKEKLARVARGFRATAEMRRLIVASGRGHSVFVTFMGRPMRGKVLRADERGLAAEVFGEEVEVGWEELPPRRLVALARRAAGRDAADSMRALLDDFAFAHGLE